MIFFQRLKKWIHYQFLKKIKPEIIGGFKNSNGTFSVNTGVSNLTHVSQRNNNLYIGNNVFIGHFNYIDALNDKVTISDHAQITNYVSILTHSSHDSIRIEDLNQLDKETDAYKGVLNIGEIFIGERTYIGPHTVIMPGTKIGKGCIVSAHSYVHGEFEDYSIIRGIPAKIVGSTKDRDAEIRSKYLNNNFSE
jgi:acetyltransferase-like isoleucine patch superfamily enzyme